jgi:pyridoxamine 5'-phosphate oxidase
VENNNKNENEKFFDLRINYDQKPLLEKEAPQDPRILFSQWFEEALKSGEIEPNGMVFSTVASLRIRSRVVLLKETTPEGFIFYTGLDSAKGQETKEHPVGSINFWWRKLHRQVRVEGTLSFVSAEKNQHYFESRPRASQLAVLSQKQGEKINSREDLLTKYQETEEKFADHAHLFCPIDWGGICLTPLYFEFWQGQPSRLHDRLCYELNHDLSNTQQKNAKNTSKSWKRYRLSP